MKDIVHPKEKVYYTMGEVAEMFDVKPSLLRYWGEEFDIIKPHRNKKGNRLYRPEDVDNIKLIYHLLREKKMKIEVAKKQIKNHKSEISRDVEIMERLLSIRATLLQIKQELLDDESEDGAVDIIIKTEDDFVDDKYVYGGVIVGDAVAGRSDDSLELTHHSKSDDSEISSTYPVDGSTSGSSEEFVEKDFTTITEIVLEEERSNENLPFREQMLFEVLPEEGEGVTLDSMIDSFLSKKWNPDDVEDDDELVCDPFAHKELADSVSEYSREEDNNQTKPTIIEPTLF